MRETVPAALDGQRLDRVVAMVAGCARSAAADLVESGDVLVDGVAVTAGATRLREGQELELRAEARPPGARIPSPDPSVAVPVVHEDAAVVVVDKPAGLVVHPGAGTRGPTMADGLLGRYPELAGVGDPHRPGIVHRLDKETSGLLVVARTPAAHRILVAAIAARKVERGYLALVWGWPESASGVIDAPVGRSERDRTRMAVTASGRAARTRYEVDDRFADPEPAALLSCSLETGRTHQIRVHLAAIGHPVVGDRRYGGIRPVVADLARFFLHAGRLGFEHPMTGEPLTFASALPPELVEVRARFQ